MFFRISKISWALWFKKPSKKPNVEKKSLCEHLSLFSRDQSGCFFKKSFIHQFEIPVQKKTKNLNSELKIY